MNNTSHRPDWDKFWFLIATMYTTRGTCDRLKVSCILVKDKKLIGAGYNGAPSGLPHCDEVGHLLIDIHCERTLHAEENAVINAERSNIIGATAYVTATPCIRCAKLLVNAGVKEIKCLGKYTNSRGQDYLTELLKDAKIKITYSEISTEELLDSAKLSLQAKGGLLFKPEV